MCPGIGAAGKINALVLFSSYHPVSCWCLPLTENGQKPEVPGAHDIALGCQPFKSYSKVVAASLLSGEKKRQMSLTELWETGPNRTAHRAVADCLFLGVATPVVSSPVHASSLFLFSYIWITKIYLMVPLLFPVYFFLLHFLHTSPPHQLIYITLSISVLLE